ncbi:PWWP domain-containing DNA repair factor 3A isoform X1 [Lutra lutra]|uniref:PWWP domain-containing DNA repair factor 3A isoform X1 n=2 Tax=Lutra lutra TaxID=9657 RepID=UPI001FD3EC0B|nr:PWWP domain-containing DNA repair factor 3A isoform X1 [Lutra lutra]XP_047566220.1 PWWP domain-containing DNA repair factor 3A isoform X1 [Lutra lutra]
MTDAQYVLCRWEERLWPAQVLARTETSTGRKRKKEFFLSVQILSLDEKIEVRSTDVETLKTAHIERIASSLASQDEVPAEPLEELAYRRSLRVALDVLNQRAASPGESSSREGRVALSSGGRSADLASSLCDPGSSSLQEAVPSNSGLERRERVHPRLAASPACGKDSRRQVAHKEELRKSESLRAMAAPSARAASRDGSGWRVRCRRRTATRPRGRKLAQEPRLGERALALPEGDGGKESSPPAPSSAPSAREEALWAKGRDPGLPLHGTDGLPTLGRPTKRLCPDGSQTLPAPQLEPGAVPRQGPRGRTSLRSAGELGRPAPRAAVELPRDLHILVEEDRQSSGESVEFNPIHSVLEEDEDDEEPPRILFYHEPRSFEVGMLVWLKHQKYPFWPAVVKSVRRREKKASVLFIEGHMDPKGRGITVSLRRLKHFDCKEKQALLNEAKEDFDQAIGWCVSLITDYRVRLGCGSFAGSFLEYYAADISYPVRKSIQQDVLGTRFPQLSKGDPEEPVAGSPQGRRRPCRKVLPDRSRAARDRANQKLVEYIVKARGAEGHLRAILKNRKPSRWLKTFLTSGQYVTCVETYLEDEQQLDVVVKYLQGLYQEAGGRAPARASGDRIRFILDVLLPEAIICAIAAVDAVDYKTAEEKYLRGPSLSYREKEIFDNQLLEERSQRC